MREDTTRIAQTVASRIREPVSGKSLSASGILRDVSLDGETLCFRLEPTPQHDDALRRRLSQQIERQARDAGWTGAVRTEFVTPEAAPEAPAPLPPPASIPGVTHIVAVASGKGGVGKSTVALQLAIGLRNAGLKVGLLDADIYGPSLPILLGVREMPTVGPDERMQPIVAHGLKCMSIGFLLGEGRPVIWRGPMVMSVVRQFLQQVAWAPLDVLVIDLPPGTGDAQLTMIQTVKLTGALIVTTPQDLALADAERGLAMFHQLDVPVLGVVENMAWYELPGGERDHPFGQGGAARLAARFGVDVVAGIPLDGRIRASGDSGDPDALAGPAREIFADLAAVIGRKLGAPLVG